MNRATLISIVAARTSEPLGIVEQIIETAFAEITDATARGDSVVIIDFGAWHPERIGARGEQPAYRAVRFRACHGWRKRLNAGQREAAE